MSNLFSRILQRSINDEDRVNQTMPSAQQDADDDLSHESRALAYCFESLGERLVRGSVLHLGAIKPGTLQYLQDYCVNITVAEMPEILDEESVSEWLKQYRTGRRYDLVLSWDVINFLQLASIEPMITFLQESLNDGATLFMSVHNRTPYPDRASVYEMKSSSELSRISTGELTRSDLFNSADFLKKCADSFETRSFQLRSGMQEIVLTRQIRTA